jgi:tetratricopeptide (TPR) repeat protein
MASLIARRLRSVVLGVLALFAPGAAVAAPAAKRLVVAVFPPAGAGAESPSLLMQAYAAELLEATGRYNEIHVKQILRLMEREHVKGQLGSTEITLQTARRLGAERAVYGSLVPRGDGFLLTVTARPLSFPAAAAAAPAKEATLQLRGGLLQVIQTGGALLAQKVAELDGVTLPKGREPSVVSTRSEPALADFAACYAGVLPQPIRPGAPVLNTSAEFHQKLLGRCTAAVQADPAYEAAWTALALERAQSLTLASYQPGAPHDCARQQKAVLADLAHVHLDRGYFPLAYLTRYWLNSRCADPAAKDLVAPLEEAIQQHPGMLIAYGYLAEHWAYTGHFERSLAAWDTYAQQNPFSAFVKGRRSHAIANLPIPRHTEAIAAAQEALALDPDNPEAALELASRYIDAGQLDQAIARLGPLAEKQRSAIAAKKTVGLIPEVHVRLAYALEQKASKDKKDASALLTAAASALDQAEQIGIEDWRTSMKLLVNRAIIQVELGHSDQAERLLRHRLDTDPQFKHYLIRWVSRDRELIGRIRIEGQPNLLPTKEPEGTSLTESPAAPSGEGRRPVKIEIFPAKLGGVPGPTPSAVPSSAARSWLPPPSPLLIIHF